MVLVLEVLVFVLVVLGPDLGLCGLGLGGIGIGGFCLGSLDLFVLVLGV